HVVGTGRVAEGDRERLVIGGIAVLERGLPPEVRHIADAEPIRRDRHGRRGGRGVHRLGRGRRCSRSYDQCYGCCGGRRECTLHLGILCRVVTLVTTAPYGH